VIPRKVTATLMVLLLVSVSGSLGLAETDPGGLLQSFLRQFGGALLGGAFAFWGGFVTMKAQLQEHARRIAAAEARMERHIEDHATGKL